MKRLLVAAVVAAALAVPAASADTVKFGFTGAEQTFTVPSNVTGLRVVAIGANGGAGGGGQAGGSGGVAQGNLPVSPGQLLYLEIGGAGANGAVSGTPDGGLGGANGGGDGGGAGGGIQRNSASGGGGGGATDVRTTPLSSNDFSSRLVIAGGGGGGGGGWDGTNAIGGVGGDGAGGSPVGTGLDGSGGLSSNCNPASPAGGGHGAQPTVGGNGGIQSGKGVAGGDGFLGTGGFGGNSQPTLGTGGGGGGGGAYGGGGGGSTDQYCNGSGGGGGGSSAFAPSVTDTSVNSRGFTLNPAGSLQFDYMPSAGNGSVVVSQVYAAFGSGDAYDHSFIELFNRSNVTVDISGWAVQWEYYVHDTPWAETTMPQGTTIAPGGYLLIQEGNTASDCTPTPKGGAACTPLPAPDVTGTIAMGGFFDHSAMVALTSDSTLLTGECPTRATSSIVDFVGYGVQNPCFEGAGQAPTIDSGNSAQRKGGGCLDDGDNSTDFLSAAQPPNPRNSTSQLTDCSAPFNSNPPKMTGTPQPGSTLTCDPGTWSGSTSFIYEWGSTDGNGEFTPFDGFNDTTYQVRDADVGLQIACRVTGKNDNTNQTGNPTLSNSKTAEPDAPSNTAAPSITGNPIVGQQVSCSTGTWDNGPLAYAYQWLRNGTPISGETTSSHTVTSDDRETTLSCQVTASNDVGSGLPATSSGVFAVAGAPTNTAPPTISLSNTGPKPTDKTATCHPGSWRDDAHQYSFRFQHSAGDVIDSSGDSHQVTVDDLGQQISCTVFVTNAAGTSSQTSDPILVPLPPPNPNQQGVHMYTAGGQVNEFDPVNLLATSDGLQKDMAAADQQRMQSAYDNFITGCRARTDLRPGPPSTDPRTITDPTTRNTALCELLLATPADQITVGPDGVRIIADPSKCVLGTSDPCAPLPIPTPAPNAAPAGGVDQSVVPVRILWDLNSDGSVDASCPGTAPVLRTIFGRGYYNVRAVLILPGSVESGDYPSITYTLAHDPSTAVPGDKFLPYTGSLSAVALAHVRRLHPHLTVPVGVQTSPALRLGLLRKAQPFTCKTSLQPPPDPPDQPCASEGYIGQVHLVGNLCPISLRRIPQDEVDAIHTNDPDLYDLLVAQNQTLALSRDRAPPGSGGSAEHANTFFPTTASAAFGQAMQEFAAPEPTTINISRSVQGDLSRLHVPAIDAPFVLDQIYISRGPMQVNGVTMTPGANRAVVVLPSDIGQAIGSVHDMVISASQVGLSLGGIPLSNGVSNAFKSAFDDAINAPPQNFVPPVDLDAIANQLKSKLDLGPFNLAGDASVDISNGVAILHANAALPALLTAPGGSPIEVGVTITGQPDGSVSLAGVHLHAGQAYLGAVLLSDLDLNYDGGLDVKGKILFPPTNTGIDIEDFRIDNQGHFRSLQLAYLAGIGQGIPVGPGIFLTKVGGGLTLNPDEIDAQAAISVGPSTGGGCPIAGADGTLTLHFGPPPFSIATNADIELVCLKIGNVNFYANTDGYVTLGASMGFDAGPLYFNASLNGAILLPNFQVEGSGSGGIRHLLSATIKAIISNRGLAGCGSIDVGVDPFSVTLAGGAGVHFNPSLLLGPAAILANLHLFVGCDLSDWETVVAPREADAAAAGTRVFSVRRHTRALLLRVEGLGAAPRLSLRGPDGTTVDLTSSDSQRTNRGLGLRADSEDASFFIVARPAAGVWTVTPAPDSVPILALQEAQILPRPHVTARVVKARNKLVLRWNVARIPGQVVRFVEQSNHGGQMLATVRGGGRGARTFIPAQARGTSRTIVAEVEENGLPRADLVVARFSASSPRVSRVTHLRIRRRGGAAMISWGPAFYASRYDVVATFTTGTREVLSTSGGRRSVFIAGLTRSAGLTVEVIGVRQNGMRGPAAVARLAAPRPPHARPKGRHRRRRGH